MFILLLGLIQSAVASTFINLSGDWDLGEGKAALRVHHAEMDRLDVLYCKRKTLIQKNVCTDTTVYEFYYDPSIEAFVLNEADGRLIFIYPKDEKTLHYKFKGSWGSDEFDGHRIR
ncbi:MAG: hypothetical protein BroJett040_21660 [Oligoflexia bacterium]|nr:MAG: hypothetical protein BroJett040_21660 [Oligoflexia bacterium]